MMSASSRVSKWARDYDIVVSRRRRLRGLSLDERVLVGLWSDERGRRRRSDLVGLGAASDPAGAIRLAECGLERHPEGTAAHRRYRDWHARLLAAQRLEREADARYRALIAALAGNVPVYDGAASPVAIAAE
jgi:hypothetical protein